MGKIIDTLDIILIAWLCFYFFKDVILFNWKWFIALVFLQTAFQGFGDGIARRLEQNKSKRKK